MFLSSLDLFVVAAYAVMLFAVAQWVSREPKGAHKSTEDYFLAGKSLPWWAIGASLIAANISAEQIIGMSGQGFAVGLAIAAYEWQAALVLLIVAFFFLPIFLKRGIYTMPQYLDQRFGHTVKTTMSIYWIFLYTAVNLTTVLWLGALAVNTLTGLPLLTGMAALGAFALAYSMYGGLKAVALTDIIQVVILIMGGLIIAWMTMGIIGQGEGVMAGFKRLYTEIPGKFDMILDKDHPAYNDLPGIWTLLGGLWVLHFSYWGFNQYIIQRALGAKSLQEAQTGLAFAAMLKLLMPVIIVLPGIAAVMLAMPEMGGVIDGNALAEKSDRAYPEVMKLMPSGLKGLIFAALIAAIVSSLASMMNSISTIFTMDIYKSMRADRSEEHYVRVGRITAFVSIVIAVLLAKPLLGSLESAFQTLQEYTGYIAPGVVAVFLMGMFWKKTTSAAAMAMLIVSIVANIALKFGMADLAFVIRIWLVFMTCIAVGVVVSLFSAAANDTNEIPLSDISFATKTNFKVMAAIVVAVLIALYAVFW
jgi:SSS family solute:Na+ symporter